LLYIFSFFALLLDAGICSTEYIQLTHDEIKIL